mgnify:CR=1 FL=1
MSKNYNHQPIKRCWPINQDRYLKKNVMLNVLFDEKKYFENITLPADNVQEREVSMEEKNPEYEVCTMDNLRMSLSEMFIRPEQFAITLPLYE